MHLEKLVIVLKTFDEARLQRLQQYLASPYFNVPPVCGALLKRLAALHPHFTEKRMQPNLLGKKDRTLSTAAKQNNAGSNLLRAIEKFIAQEEWQKSNTQMFYQLQGFQQMQLPERLIKYGGNNLSG